MLVMVDARLQLECSERLQHQSISNLPSNLRFNGNGFLVFAAYTALMNIFHDKIYFF